MTIFSTVIAALAGTPSGLESKSAAERAAALASTTERIERERYAIHEKLSAQQRAAQHEASARTEAAAAAVEKRRAELVEALGRDWHGTLRPLAATYLADPSRPRAEAMRVQLVQLVARIEFELGVPADRVSPAALVDVFAPTFLERYPASDRLFGGSGLGLGLIGERAGGMLRALGSAITFSNELSALEADLDRQCAACTGGSVAECRELYEARCHALTLGDRADATHAVAELRRERGAVAASASFEKDRERRERLARRYELGGKMDWPEHVIDGPSAASEHIESPSIEAEHIESASEDGEIEAEQPEL
jgi:hypothetical protein